MRRSPTILTTVVAASALFATPAHVRAQADFSIVHNFNGPAPPAQPVKLIEGLDGNFYGTTWGGGAWGFRNRCL